MRDDDWNLVLYDVGFPDRETQVARLSSLITIYKALTSILAFSEASHVGDWNKTGFSCTKFGQFKYKGYDSN